jgi:hypothetical protein
MYVPGAVAAIVFLQLAASQDRGGRFSFAALPGFVVWLGLALFCPIFAGIYVAERKYTKPHRQTCIATVALIGFFSHLGLLGLAGR